MNTRRDANTQSRRDAVLEILRSTGKPVSAAVLATQFHVSRQIIVGDVALLRAAGEQITSTPRGYMIQRPQDGIIYRLVCRHNADEMGDELNAIVDQGCEALDVIVEHPLYGQLTGNLNLYSRYDVEQFLQRCALTDAHPLSDLTGGIHLHTIRAPDEEAYQRVKDALRELRILLEA